MLFFTKKVLKLIIFLTIKAKTSLGSNLSKKLAEIHFKFPSKKPFTNFV